LADRCEANSYRQEGEANGGRQEEIQGVEDRGKGSFGRHEAREAVVDMRIGKQR
jgi:hypothetical protein